MSRRVTVEAVVENSDATTAFARISDFERYPEWTDTIRDVRITGREGCVVDSEWTATFRNGLLRWGEREVLDETMRLITFVQTWGEFKSFGGTWQVDQLPDAVLVRFNAEFDLGFGPLAEVLDPIAERALAENIQQILCGLFGPATTFREQG